MLEFFILTPLPGSEDHKVLYEKGVWMDPDMNKYHLEPLLTPHPKMGGGEWKEAYRTAWGHYYTDDHLETIVRRATNASERGPTKRREEGGGPSGRDFFHRGTLETIGGRHQYSLADAGPVLVLERGAGRGVCTRCNGASSASNTATTAALACRSRSPLLFYGRYAAEIARKVALVARRWRHLKSIVRKDGSRPARQAPTRTRL